MKLQTEDEHPKLDVLVTPFLNGITGHCLGTFRCACSGYCMINSFTIIIQIVQCYLISKFTNHSPIIFQGNFVSQTLPSNACVCSDYGGPGGLASPKPS